MLQKFPVNARAAGRTRLHLVALRAEITGGKRNCNRLACRQVVSYYEDEVKVEEEFWPRGFAAGFKVPGWGAGVDFNPEELGNWIRDWMHEWGRRERERRAEHRHNG
jgi:hypothetical protein